MTSRFTLGLSATLFALSGVLSFAAAANAAGVDVTKITRGNVSFSQDGNRLVVRASNGSIIEYNRFSVEAGQIMQFIQPSSTSRVLNRVTGAELSRIDGSLLSNGIVYLVNPQGIRIGNGALINVGGFYAAAGAMSDNDFIRGQNNFTNLSGKVTNEGMIQAQSVALVGQYVANRGTINVDDGMVAMAAGDTVYLQNGSAPIMVTVSRSQLGADGSGAGTQAAVTNTGTINAGKGKVAMASGDFYALAMDLSGTIIGKSIEARGGNGGVVAVNGTLDASSSTDKGGTIDLFGDRVGLFGNALVNANGATGGGNVRIGGDYQGKNAEVRNASQTYVAPTAQIYADALTSGNGGNVIVWSDNGTQFYGAASAQAGQLGGNGGFVEVSGKHYLDFRGSVSTNAPKGLKGKLLLDPEDLTINNDGPNNNSGSAQAFNTTGSSAVLTWATIDAALANNDVTVQSSGGAGTGGTITISQAGVLTHKSSLTITAAAGKDIVINASVTNDGSVAAGAGSGVPNITFAVSGAGQIQLGADVTTAGGVVTFDGPVSLIGNAAVDTTNSGGTPVGAGINFLGPLDGGFDLVLTAGTSNITFSGGAVGGVTPLGTVRINSAYNVIMASDFTANAFYQYVGTGTTAFFGVINLGAFDFIGSNLEMNGVGTNVADTIDIRQSGNFTLADGANIEVTNTDGYFYQRTYGGTNFIGGNITARTFVGFRSDVVLTGADAVVLTMTNGVAGNYLGFSNITGNGQDLTLASNTEIRVRGNIGTGADPLGDIRILNLVDVNLLGTVDAASFTQDAGSGTTTFNGTQNYTGALGLNVSTNMIAVNAPITTATGPITFIGTGGIVVAGNITAGGTGEINITGNTNVDPALRSTVGVTLNSGKTIQTTDGDLNITGTGGSNVDGSNHGVYNLGGTITSGGAGNVVVMGTGGTVGSGNDGVYNRFDESGPSLIYGVITSTGSGTVTVTGQGGACGIGSRSNDGIINFGIISSGGGDVFVTGTGGTGDGGVIRGIDNIGTITSGGAGNVTVTGIGGSGGGTLNDGILNFIWSTIRSGGAGYVQVTGTGGGGASGGNNRGVKNVGGTITSGGGDVTVVGFGGAGSAGSNYGVSTHGNSGATGIITSGGGNVTVEGTSGTGGTNNDAILIDVYSLVAAPGDLTLISNGGAINQTSGTITVVGTTTITAGTSPTFFDVTLAQSTNDFGGAVSVVSANNVSLADANALTLGASTVENDFTATASGGIVVAGNITAGGTGEINITGNTNVDPTLRSTVGVKVNAFVTIQSTDGDLNITGTGGMDAGGFNIGVENVGTITSSGSGSVTVTGTGGMDDDGFNFGVYNYVTITSGGTGRVTVTGTGGSGYGYNYGVDNVGTITSGVGDVFVTGTGGSGDGGFNRGALNYGTITSSGAGSVAVTGMGGSGGSDNDAILIGVESLVAAPVNLTLISNGGAINQTGGTITVVGTTTITAGDNDVTLAESTNDFGGAVSVVSANNVSLADINALTLGASTVENDFTATASGGIIVAGNITAGGTGEINITGNTNVDPILRSTVGVSVNASVTIATTNGDLYITGTGGSSVSGNNYGVANSGTITSIGAGNVIVMGTGGTGGSVSDDLNIGVHNFHGTITSGGGDVTVTGMGGLSGSGFGIYNYSGTIASGGAGNVLVQGTGGSGDNSCGVYNLSNTISSGGLGSVTVTGMSGSGSGVNQQGLINGGTITSGGGDVFVTGTTGYGDGRNVGVDNYGLISSGGVGNVTVEGTTGGSDGYSYGVYNGNTITSGGIGNVTVEGTGGSGANGNNQGISNRSTITSGGGNVALIGTGGNGAGGYNLGVYNYGTITSGGGNIALTGTGGSGGSNNDAIYFMVDTVITAPRNLELTSLGGAIYQPGADPLIVVGTTTITAGTNDVTLAESTNDFGGAVVVVSANNVLLADANALTLGASTVQNDFTATASGGVVVAGNITAGGTGEINITGNTNVDPDLRSDTGVTVNSGVTIQTTNGDLNITGTGGSVGGYNSGVYNYGTITSGGAGNVVVMGTGGSGAPGYNVGVYNFGPLFGTGGIITSGGIGSVTVTGIGGTGGSNNYGVINSFGLIKSGDSGAVTVTGTGGNGPGGVNLGVVNLRGTITSDGNGSVTVTGMAGSGLGGSNYGVYNYGGTITSGGGDVTVVGIGGTGDGGENYGVANSRTITSIGTGNVIVMGTGGTGGSDNDAIVMDVDSLVAAPGDLALISNGGAINQISGTITVVGATTITANAPNTDIYLNGGPNDFAGTVTIDNTGGAASNVRDFKLRNMNAAAGAVVNLDSATSLRDLTITYDNAGYTLPTLTSLFLRTVSLNINGTLTLGTITGHGDTFNIAAANLVLGGTISGLDTMILQNIDPNGDITLFGVGGLEISSSMWTTIQNGVTNVQFGSLTNTGSITVAADWENNNNVTMNFLPGGTGHVYVDNEITGTGSLTINGSGNTTTVSADITQTAIHIADAVEVDAPLITLTATAGDITIDGAIVGVNGGESLSLAATGDITLGGDIGNSVGHKLMEFRVDCGNDVGDTITFTQNGQVVAAEIVALNCSNVCIEPGARMMGGDATSTLDAPATMATIVALGDIEFNADDFRFGQNHKLTGFGDITIGGFAAPNSLSVTFGDVNAVGDLRVNANSITLLGRAGGPIATNTGGVVNDPQVDYVVGGRVYFSVAPIMGGSNPGNRAVFSNPTGNVDALGTLGAYSKSVYPTAITSTLLIGAGGATLDLGAVSGVSYINPATIIPQAMSSMPPIGLLGDADTLDEEDEEDDAAAPVADDQTTEPISTPTQTEKTATDVPVNAIGTAVPVALH